MYETADDAGSRMLGRRLRDQELATVAVIHVAPHSPVETLAIVPQHIHHIIKLQLRCEAAPESRKPRSIDRRTPSRPYTLVLGK
jgi:hypothetical protein